MEHDQRGRQAVERAVGHARDDEMRDAAMFRNERAASETEADTGNALSRIAFEIGIALAIPLTGALAAAWILRAMGIF